MITQQEMVDRIRTVALSATDEQWSDGLAWYWLANGIAMRGAEDMGISLTRSALMFSALSPQLRWSKNVKHFRTLAQGRIPRGMLMNNVSKAIRILHAEDPWLMLGRGLKTHNFAVNIITGGLDEGVTVDTWASQIAGVSIKELNRVGVYETVAEAYRIVARELGVTPPQMQAITWIAARGSGD